MSNSLLLIGGGGHCNSVIDSLNLNEFSKIGIIDIPQNIGKKINGIEIIGTDDDLKTLFNEYKCAFITIGSVGNPKFRIKIFNLLKEIGYTIVNIIDSTSIVSKNTEVGVGNFIGKGVIINSGSKIGNNCILNTGSIIEHDVIIGDFSHIAPGATVLGNVRIGNNVHIGANSTIKQGITIGENTIIGMGSNVLTNISDNRIAYGNPCKEKNE